MNGVGVVKDKQLNLEVGEITHCGVGKEKKMTKKKDYCLVPCND
jgi:hypothetical protein